MLLSSFASVGLVVGIIRMLTGHTFFFSTAETNRETELTKSIADTMKLSAKV